MFKSIVIKAWKCAVYVVALESYTRAPRMIPTNAAGKCDTEAPGSIAQDAHAYAIKVADMSVSLFNG